MTENAHVTTNKLPIRQISPRWRALAMCSSKDAREKLSYPQALSFEALPLGIFCSAGQEFLSIALLDASREAELRFICGCPLSPEIVEREALIPAIESAYLGSSFGDAGEQSAPELLRSALLRAEMLDSSDIHIEPGRVHSRLRLRIDGRLSVQDDWKVSHMMLEEIVRHVQVLAQLDTTQKNKPQEGSFQFEARTKTIESRVSVLPVIGGAKLAIRLQANSFHSKNDLSELNSLAQLGLDAEQMSMLDFALCINRGAIIVAGGTGSGKTTLLYAALRLLDSQAQNIVTVEDPIEHQMHGVNQIRLQENLSGILPSILRQDPDVLMVGEMRTDQVAQLVLKAAISGSLVLSSVHASHCLESLTRLKDLGITPAQMSAGIKLIVSSRLVARNCQFCKRQCEIPSRFSQYFNLHKQPVYHSPGCDECKGTGIRGRIGVYEFLFLNRVLRSSILAMPLETFDGESLFDLACLNGYQPLRSKISTLLRDGVVSPKEVCKTLGLSPRVFE